MKATAAVFAFLLIFAGAGALLRIGLGEVSSRPESPRYAQPVPRTTHPVTFLDGPSAVPADDAPATAGGGTGGFPGDPPALADTSPERKRRIDSINNLKQIALAFHSYHDAYGHFPADITDDEGRPLLSWRVAILPFIEQAPLYKQFKLDEPWDSPNNKKLLAKMPALYRLQTDTDLVPDPFDDERPGRLGGDSRRVGTGDPQKTYYVGFVGKGTAFERGAQLKVVDFTDGTSNTILIVEAANPVPWTKPEDVPYSAKKPIPALGAYGDVIHAAFADGSVHSLRKNFDQDEMRKAIVRNDGEVVDIEKLEVRKKKVPAPGAGGPGAPRAPAPASASPRLEKMREENARLQEMLQQTLEEVQALRKEMDQLKEQYATKREKVEADKLLAEREQLKQQIEQATAELKAMRDELQRLKRGLEKE